MRRTLALALAAVGLAAAAPPPPADVRARLPQDEVIYFLLPDRFDNADPGNDRGGLKGDRLTTGFDPTSKAFYNGGDLKGVLRRLDYIQSLGATAIWLAPIFKNKPVQGAPGHESAGYHGYWITDFTTVDPHFGTEADFKALVDAVHARGMKLYMDIVINHTADVIQYAECPASSCAYRGRADYPYTRRGGVTGPEINAGFQGDAMPTAANWAKLTDPNWAYTVRVPEAERTVKKPDWLNNPIYYHNRGDSLFRTESSTFGDFSGLDDLMTEHPRVVQGMIDIYGSWIDRFGIDGFRIDTEKHVNPEFWQAFNPAMLARARARGIPNFHIFAEVMQDDPEAGPMAIRTIEDRLPATLDFGLWAALVETVAKDRGTAVLSSLFAEDGLYAGGPKAALQLPTFTGNHDKGRFAWYVRQANPKASDAEVLERVKLAHAMILLLRGVPTIYAGDEQGFAGSGGDQASRQSLFASKVAEYNAEKLIGTDRTTATDNFGRDHPLFRHIATLAKLRTSTPALTRGRQLFRRAQDRPGLFAVSRFDPVTNAEVLIAFNTSPEPLEVNVLVETRSTRFRQLFGTCPAAAQAPGSVHLSLPAFGTAVCAAEPPR
jgi:glycosidase